MFGESFSGIRVGMDSCRSGFVVAASEIWYAVTVCRHPACVKRPIFKKTISTRFREQMRALCR